MRQSLRKTAIVLLAASGIVALLLWIRTGFSCDTVFGPLPGAGGFVVTSRQGGLSLGYLREGALNFGSHSLPPATVPQLPYRGGLGFSACNTAERVAIRTPYWFYVLASSAVLAALVMQSPLRFSLQTLLVAMTLLAVVLGIIAVAAG